MNTIENCSFLQLLGSSFSVAGLSLSTMLKLFPELSGSLNVSFQPACSKSKRRFPEAQKPPSTPVTIDLWDRISLDGLIRKHTKEVTHLYITQVPTIMARLDDMNERKGTRLSSRPFALDEKEREQLKKYLHRPVRDSDVEHVLSEATPIEQKRASPEFAEVAEFPDMVWNAESDDNILNSSQFPNIMLDTEPLSSPNFPEISFEMSKEDDPAIDANFPDIGLEEPFEKDDGMVCV